ncbi:MAG: hypothetical protein IJ551_04395 [Prevotella sp.]|nr:hypothetical protein [Prevotella sp.]
MKRHTYTKPSCRVIMLAPSKLICTSGDIQSDNTIGYYDETTSDVW